MDKPKNKEQYILDYIFKHPDESGIIYCSTRKNVEAVYDLLNNKGISVAKYHAGMSSAERKKMQDDFVFHYVSIVVATNAFLSKTNKKLLRRLIEQLVLEGYLWVGDYQVIKKGEMLNVSGVGENKYMKYGNRFLSLIEACIEDDPELIQSKAQVGQSEETCYMTSTYKKGLKLGVREIEKISQKGNPYTVLMYPENVQRLLVEHYICNDIDG